MKIDWIPGAKIYGLPTGNNARWNKDIVEFEVVKMKRKYVTLIKDGIEEDYCPETGKTVRAIRAGDNYYSWYKFFQTKDDYIKYLENQKKRLFVTGLFNGYTGSKQISDKNINLIYDILMDDSEDEAK